MEEPSSKIPEQKGISGGGAHSDPRPTGERLVETEEKFRLLVESVQDYAIFLLDPEGRVASWNRGAQRIKGYTAGEIIGRHFSVFYPPDAVERRYPQMELEQALAGGRFEDEGWRLRKDGTRFWANVVITSLRDRAGRHQGFAKVTRDLTERRLGEEDLRAAHAELEQRVKERTADLHRERERLITTLSSIGDGVIVTDPEGRVTFINPTAQALTGWNQEEARGRPLEAVFRVHNEATRRTVENPVARVMATGLVCGLANHSVLVSRDGTERPIDDSGAPVLGEDGKVAGVVLVFRDISRKREEEITRSRLAAIVESSEDAIIGKSLDGVITSWNGGAEKVYGYGAAEAIGRPISLLIPPGHPNDYPSAVDRLRKGEKVGHYETVRRRKDGRLIDVSVTISPLWNEEGEITGTSVIARDITEGRRAAEALRRSEAHKAAILKTALDALITIDHAGHVIDFNPAAEAIFGWSFSEVSGRQIAELIIPPSLRERHHQGLARYLATGDGPVLNRRMEMTALRKDGTEFPVELAIVRISNDGPPLFSASLRDITERRRAEDSLRFLSDASAALVEVEEFEVQLQKVARLSLPFLADACVVDLLSHDQNLRRLAIAHVDPARQKLFEELHARWPSAPGDGWGPYHVLRTGQPELMPEISEELLASTAKDEEHLRMLRTLSLRSCLSIPMGWRDRTLGVITFFLDRSRRRYGPADLRLAQDLVQRAAIAIDNARLYSEMKDADRRKDEFLAMLAHELRNPLAPIRNAVHLARLSGADPETVEKARQIIERQVQHMGRLVDDLLDVSRIMRGRVDLRREPVDMATVVERAMEVVRPILEAGQQELVVSLPTEPLRLDADLVRLTQVIGNLLNNAAKYARGPGRVWIGAERQGGEAVVRVKDEGMGISHELLPYVFELFVQGDKSLERSQGGLGIGLTVVKKLVEMHGGSVSVHSEGANRGTEFTIRLPVLSPGFTPAEAQPVSRPAKVSPHRILVVDDNVDAAESMAMLLRIHGHEVLTAHNGPEALEAAADFQPQAVVLDIGLPGINGYDVARRLRGQPRFRETLLVAVTGYGQESDRMLAREAGFDHHLTKPVDPDELQALVAELRRSRR